MLPAEPSSPHLTGFVTFSASSYVFKPLIILERIQSLKSLSTLVDECHFATSNKGWITKNLFTVYALHLCSEISRYRLFMPAKLRNSPILLILDGHQSRLNYTAARIFRECNVEVLILPEHTSHVLQPFDVVIASPLKAAFSHELHRLMSKMMFENFDPGEKADRVRKNLVESFLNAQSVATSRGNCFSAFRKTGFVPLAKQKPLSSPFAMLNDETLHPGKRKNIPTTNSKLLTSDEGLKFLWSVDHNTELTEEIIRSFKMDNAIESVYNRNIYEGIPLTEIEYQSLL
jgi:hypothetical protein